MLEVTDTNFKKQSDSTRQDWKVLKTEILEGSSDQLLYYGRDLLQQVQFIVCACLLMLDATYSRGTPERIVAERWVTTRSPSKAWMLGNARLVQQERKHDRLLFDGRNDDDLRPKFGSKI